MTRAHADDTPPADLDIDNGAAISTAVSFTVASNRPLYAWWFWVPTTNTGTYTLALYEITGDDDPGPAAGTLLASKAVAAASVVAGQYNRVNFDTPVDVVSTKAYRANRHASSGRYVRTTGAFNGASISNGGITLIESGSNPNGQFAGVLRNGTFREAVAGNYPSQAFLTADYHIDVDDEDDAPPAVDGALVATTTAPTAALAGVEAMSGTLSTTTTAPASAFEGTVAAPVSGVLSAVTLVPTAAIVASTPVTERPSSWQPLLDMVRTAKQQAGVRVRAVACPKCGDPLEVARGVLHCRWDGSVY